MEIMHKRTTASSKYTNCHGYKAQITIESYTCNYCT